MENKQFIKYPFPNQTYLHYKGGLYRILTLAKNTETDETMVIYESLHFGSVYARSLDSWNEPLSENSQTHPELTERFTWLEDVVEELTQTNQ